MSTVGSIERWGEGCVSGGSALVAAPGAGIYATLPRAAYGTLSGTSTGAAETAGLAALLAASGRSNSEASAQIRGATDPLAGRSFGRINVAKALGANVAPQPRLRRAPRRRQGRRLRTRQAR